VDKHDRVARQPDVVVPICVPSPCVLTRMRLGDWACCLQLSPRAPFAWPSISLSDRMSTRSSTSGATGAPLRPRCARHRSAAGRRRHARDRITVQSVNAIQSDRVDFPESPGLRVETSSQLRARRISRSW